MTSAASRYGFRRVERVRLVVEGDEVTATVTGVTHRYPRTLRVPLRVASRLVAEGAPLTVEGREPGDRTGAT